MILYSIELGAKVSAWPLWASYTSELIVKEESYCIVLAGVTNPDDPVENG